MNLEEYIENGHYLPDFLKTQDDQDMFFGVLDSIKRKRAETDFGNYFDVHILEFRDYILKDFLPRLARSGYVLQSSRVKEDNWEHFLESGLYLPVFLQDFHDQKDFFKYFNTLDLTVKIPWTQAHVCTIDLFLWLCMRTGNLKLQKCRRKLEYENILQDMYEYDTKMRNQKFSILHEILQDRYK